MSSKTVFIDSQWPIYKTEAKFSSFPSSAQYNVRRRGNIMGNKIKRHSLYLNSSHPPSEEKLALVEVPQTVNLPSISQNHLQIAESLDTINKSLNKKYEDLRELGAEKYMEKQIKESSSSPAKDEAVVSYPEKAEPIAADVISAQEVRPTKTKRKKNVTLPIMTHENNSKRKKAKK